MVKPGYKQTEIGIIPEDWEVVSVSRYGDVVGGGTPSTAYSDYWNGTIAWCTPTDITGTKGRTIAHTSRYITELGLNNSAAVLLPVGTVLLCTRATIGEARITTIPITTNQGFKNIVPKDGSALFLYYLLQTKKKEMLEKAIGSTFLELSKKELCSIPVQFPSKPEQDRIAEALSDIDDLISSLEKLIEKKKAIKQGAMQQLLTGKIRLPGFIEEWKEVKLKKRCIISRGGSPRPIQDYLTDDSDGIHWIKIGDVDPADKYIVSTREKIKPSGAEKSRSVFKGDLILSNSMSFGRPYLLKINGCIHDGWLAIQEYQDAFDVDFLYYALCAEYIYQQYVQMAAGSSVKNLNKEKVGNLVIRYPEDKKEQKAIAAILSDMDDELEVLNKRFSKAQDIKLGMMQQLLTGQIRLIEKGE